MVGEIFGERYRFLRLLGQGGMGAVYEAEDTTTGQRVAVKMIHADRRLSTTLVSRFHREARAATAVSSAHIAQVLDTGVAAETGLPFMVIEYLEGEDLDALLRRTGPLLPDTALRIIGQACIGLARAHEAGIVHRDIKPANLFLSRSERGEITVKILDFGIAKLLQDEPSEPTGPELTRTGSMVGSPLFMSPEQARGIKEIDHRTDIWSFGVALHVALAGSAPHQGILAIGDLIMAVCSRQPEPIQRRAPWIHREVAAIVHRALRLAPAERFPTVDAMLRAIQDLVGNDLTLRDEMLVPIPSKDRAGVARRLETTTAFDDESAPSSVQVVMTLGPIDLGETADAPSGEPRPPASTGAADAPIAEPAPPSMGKAARSAEVEGTRPRSRARVVALAAVLLGLGALVLRRPSSAPTIVDPARTAVERAPVPPALLSSWEAAGPEGMRRGRLWIEPSDAAVEIDGVIATAIEGSVEITGLLGSVHQVHLSKGREEVTADVVVAADGVFPRKVGLGKALAGAGQIGSPGGAKPGLPVGRAAPSFAATAQASSPEPPLPPPHRPPPEIGESFE